MHMVYLILYCINSCFFILFLQLDLLARIDLVNKGQIGGDIYTITAYG